MWKRRSAGNREGERARSESMAKGDLWRRPWGVWIIDAISNVRMREPLSEIMLKAWKAHTMIRQLWTPNYEGLERPFVKTLHTAPPPVSSLIRRRMGGEAEAKL